MRTLIALYRKYKKQVDALGFVSIVLFVLDDVIMLIAALFFLPKTTPLLQRMVEGLIIGKMIVIPMLGIAIAFTTVRAWWRSRKTAVLPGNGE